MTQQLTNRTISASVLGVVVGLVLSLGLSPRADAATMNADEPTDLSCWLDLESAQSVCVKTGSGLVEAVEEQTGIVLDIPDGAIIDGTVYRVESSDAQASGESRAMSNAVSPAAYTVVATLYEEVNYAGSTLVLSAPSACGYFSYNNLGGYGWNDRPRSFRAYAGCRGTAYRDNDLTGSSSSTTSAAYSFGNLNGQVSSFKLTP